MKPLTIFVSIQPAALGIIADILLKVYYGQNGRKPYLVEHVVQ